MQTVPEHRFIFVMEECIWHSRQMPIKTAAKSPETRGKKFFWERWKKEWNAKYIV